MNHAALLLGETAVAKWDGAEFRPLMVEYLSLQDALDATFDLRMPGGEGLEFRGLIRQLLRWCETEQKEDLLIAWLERHRPNVYRLCVEKSVFENQPPSRDSRDLAAEVDSFNRQTMSIPELPRAIRAVIEVNQALIEVLRAISVDQESLHE